MPLSSDDMEKRSEDRLQAVYEAIERGEQPDLRKLSLLTGVEILQLGRVATREAVEAQREADERYRSSSGGGT